MLHLSEVEVLRDLEVLNNIVKGAGRKLVLHQTFGARFSRMPFEVAAVGDDQGFIRLVLGDESIVPVVIETQVASGYPGAQRWPRTFVGLRASGRAFALVTRGINRPLAMQLEGDRALWGAIGEIRDGVTIATDEASPSPAAVSATESIALHDAEEDAFEASKLEWARQAEATRAEYQLELRQENQAAVDAGATGQPASAPPASTDVDEEEQWANELFKVIVDGDWHEVMEQHRGDVVTYSVEAGGISSEYSLLDELLDATLPSHGLCEIAGSIGESEAIDLVRGWVDRHPELAEPYIFEAADKRWAVIRLDDGLDVVPGCLEGDGLDNDLDMLVRRHVIETVWSFVANWDTGAATSFQYLEELVRYHEVYYFLVWTESGNEQHRLGRFHRESDARLLAASRYSEAEHYRELAEKYPDPDYE